MQQFSHYITEVFFSVPEGARYILIFVISFFEGMPVVGSILPGGTIALLVGTLSAEAFISPVVAVILIAVGTFLGDMVGFLVGRYFKDTPWLKRLVSHEKHQKSWDLFDRHIAMVVIFGKLLPVVRSMPSLFAAVRGVVIKRYVLYSALGSLLWAVVGVYAGNLLTKLLGENAILIIVGLFFLSGVVVVVRKKR